MAYENNDKKMDSVFSNRVKAGKRRTYFFDVRATRGNDYFLTITESRKRAENDGYERHKIFLYKEDFNKFLKGLTEAIDYVKTELMPDFNFDAFNHDTPFDSDENLPAEIVSGEPAEIQTESQVNGTPVTGSTENIIIPPANNINTEDVDKW